ncbi:hypothetical protein BHM03_00025077 [Ensete ventricosum]|nr:hypothetical protein BHM03_00025077 [Ensete ventricosum]
MAWAQGRGGREGGETTAWHGSSGEEEVDEEDASLRSPATLLLRPLGAFHGARRLVNNAGFRDYTHHETLPLSDLKQGSIKQEVTNPHFSYPRKPAIHSVSKDCHGPTCYHVPVWRVLVVDRPLRLPAIAFLFASLRSSSRVYFPPHL